MINLAQLAGNAPLYIVHLSNSLGLDYLRLAQARHQRGGNVQQLRMRIGVGA